MRIGFYAPLKHPDHPVPSGDRRVARLLMQALRDLGHDVTVESRFRSLDLTGNPDRQARLARLGSQLAARLIRRYRRQGATPDLWFTYHLYYKAPDYVGPVVADALGIPYVVAEASDAPKRANGAWDLGYRVARAAILRADAIVTLNPNDDEILHRLVPAQRLVSLPPFLETARYDGTPLDRNLARATLSESHGLDKSRPWLLAVGMMRPGAKLQSYRLLGDALRRLPDCPPLLVVGRGPAEAAVQQALQGLPVYFLGARDKPEDLIDLYRAADLLVWPAVDEAYGMALLEAQAAGLPVIAGRVGGVPAIIEDGETGLLVPPGDDIAFAQAVQVLLGDPERCHLMSDAARRKAVAQHDIANATHILARTLAPLVQPGQKRSASS